MGVSSNELCEYAIQEYGLQDVVALHDPIGLTRPFVASENPDYENGAYYLLVDSSGRLDKIRMHPYELDTYIESLLGVEAGP